MRKDTLYLTLSRDITSYTITSGQRAIATNVNYAVTIESPTLTTNLAGRDVSLIISDTEGNTLTSATTFYPDTKNPYKAVTGSLLLDGGVYGKFFDGKPIDTAVRLPIVIRDKSVTLLSSDIVVVNGGEVAEPSASDETVAGLVNAIRFYDLAEFKAWLDGVKERPDGLKPTDIVVGQWVHTQQDGSFICKELIGSEPSVTKNFTTIVTQFPLTGTLKMNPDNGVGLSVYSGDVYNDSEATSFSIDAITYKGDAFTFTAGDNQVARQKDNYALENRVNSTMTATLNAVKADNANTYQAMLPVMNTTVEARDRAETAAQGAKSSETRAVEAETRAATSEANALAYKNSAAASEENAGLYRQQALASAQKAEQEAVTATTKASEASSSANKAAASSADALFYKNSAETFSNSAASWADSASEYSAAADTSADLAKMSEDNAAKSEANAATSAANAASSESKSLTYKETAVASADLSTTNKNSAADFSASASASAVASASSATAAANSATAAAKSAAEAASQVTDTLKRLTFAGGRFYSKYFNANTASITWDTSKAPGDHALMAWNDRYLVLSTSMKGGWFTMLGKDLSFIASAPYHYNYHIYDHALFYQVGFNGERVAIFYRLDEYNAEKGICNYAEVLDANTGEVLIEKTFTDEEMQFIKAAPCWGLAFTCILKNGDMVHRGTIFSGEDLSIKGYVATEDGFAFNKNNYSTYCCYLTANADNGYSGEDPIIVQSNDYYSFWVDDRWTLDADGNPIITLRNFLIDGIFDENKVETRRDVGVLFSSYSTGWGDILHRAIVHHSLSYRRYLYCYIPSLDETKENRIVFRRVSVIEDAGYNTPKIALNQFIPVNFRIHRLTYNHYPFYLQKGEFVYPVKDDGTISDAPLIVFCGNKRAARTAGAYYLPSVAYNTKTQMRLIPCDRYSNDGSSFIYPAGNT